MPKLTSRARRDSPSSLLERILNTPHLPDVVPRLQPEVLHRVIQTCGLHDCGELVALATPEQLNRVFDLDLWRPERPGADTKFDAARFGDWLELLLDCGESVAADKLKAMDLDIVVTGLAQHIAVFDRAAVSRDGDEIGGYLVETRETASWEAIASLLRYLDTEHHDYFHRLMVSCRTLSYSTPEADGFHSLASDREQNMFDLAIAREQRREQQGYLSPAESRAFLQMARQVTLTDDTPPVRDPIAMTYFRMLDSPAAANADDEQPATDRRDNADLDAATAGIVELLRHAGVLSDQPRALLSAGHDRDGTSPGLAQIQAYLVERDAGHDLAFLANALVAGCSIQGRRLTEREAADAAIATCNLGLENWPSHWRPPAELVSAFQVGWKVLHEEVASHAAQCLIDALGEMRIDDDEMQYALDELRIDLRRRCQDGTPWIAAEALDAIATLDLPAWAVLVAAIAECPVMHAAVNALKRRERSVDPRGFVFIGENSQITAIREYLRSLQTTLLG